MGSGDEVSEGVGLRAGRGNGGHCRRLESENGWHSFGWEAGVVKEYGFLWLGKGHICIGLGVFF